VSAPASTSPRVIARPSDRAEAIRALAVVEAKRSLRGPSFWIAVALCAVMAYESQGLDWQGGAYEMFTVGFIPLAGGIFCAGVVAGSRDRRRGGTPCLAEEAALGPTERAIARLLGLVPLVVLASIAVIAFAVGIRIEGGLWIGNRPGRTDRAVHGVAELLAPMLMFVVAAAAGVALGRVVRRKAVGIAIGIVAFFVMTGMYWALQFPPVGYVSPVRTQPFSVDIDGPATDPTALPADWLLDRPGDPSDEPDDRDWDRVLVSQSVAAWHDVYLLGLALGAIGLAVRSRVGRRLILVGLMVAALGATGQAVMMPDGATPNEVPQ